jgi:DUF971 family protein
MQGCPDSRPIKHRDSFKEQRLSDKQPWPTEIRLRKERKALLVRFNDDRDFELSAEFLRVLSPSAEVQGHSPEQRQTVPGKADIAVTAIDPVGNYAVRLTFSDGHNTGLFSWTYLRHLGENHESLWAGYLADLKAKGMTRDRAR